MRYLAYFTVPTLAGWVVGSLSCMTAMAVFGHETISFSGFREIALLAGMLIIAPTFCFVSFLTAESPCTFSAQAGSRAVAGSTPSHYFSAWWSWAVL